MISHQRSDHFCDEQMIGFMGPQSWRKEDNEEEIPLFSPPFPGGEVQRAAVVLRWMKVGVSLSLAVLESMDACQKWLTTASAKIMMRGVSSGSKLTCRVCLWLVIGPSWETENLLPSLSELNCLLGFPLCELLAHFLPLHVLKITGLY